jgi:hypothetical protein
VRVVMRNDDPCFTAIGRHLRMLPCVALNARRRAEAEERWFAVPPLPALNTVRTGQNDRREGDNKRGAAC